MTWGNRLIAVETVHIAWTHHCITFFFFFLKQTPHGVWPIEASQRDFYNLFLVEYIFPVEALICILGCVLLPSNNCCEWDEGFSRGEKKTESGRMDNEIKSLVLLAFCEHLLTDFRPDNQPLGTVRYHHQKRKVCRRASSFWSEVPLCRTVLKSVSPQACPCSL